jgi:hypothetical protein
MGTARSSGHVTMSGAAKLIKPQIGLRLLIVWGLVTAFGLFRQRSLIDAVEYGYPRPWLTFNPDASTAQYVYNWMHFAQDVILLSVSSAGVFLILEALIRKITRPHSMTRT